MIDAKTNVYVHTTTSYSQPRAHHLKLKYSARRPRATRANQESSESFTCHGDDLDEARHLAQSRFTFAHHFRPPRRALHRLLQHGSRLRCKALYDQLGGELLARPDHIRPEGAGAAREHVAIERAPHLRDLAHRARDCLDDAGPACAPLALEALQVGAVRRVLDRLDCAETQRRHLAVGAEDLDASLDGARSNKACAATDQWVCQMYKHLACLGEAETSLRHVRVDHRNRHLGHARRMRTGSKGLGAENVSEGAEGMLHHGAALGVSAQQPNEGVEDTGIDGALCGGGRRILADELDGRACGADDIEVALVPCAHEQQRLSRARIRGGSPSGPRGILRRHHRQANRRTHA
eukprot:scaffold98949_cov66-Phaeocystis_antarctica.AAC.2